jgi:hypothetical protein
VNNGSRQEKRVKYNSGRGSDSASTPRPSIEKTFQTSRRSGVLVRTRELGIAEPAQVAPIPLPKFIAGLTGI